MTAVSASHVNELKRDSLGLPSTIAVSLSFIAPTIGAIFETQLIAGKAGASTPFVFAIGAIALALNASTFAQFAKRVPSSGILYSSVAKGLGAPAGLVMGLVLLVVYGIVSVANLDLFGGFVSNVLKHRASIDIAWWVIVIVIVVVIALFAWFSVSASMKFDLLLLAFEMTVTGILFVVIIGRGGHSGQDIAVLGPTLSPKFSGLGLGFVYVALAFFGFEACTTVAEESKNPRRSVPIALIGSVVISGVFFVFASYATIIGFGTGHVNLLTGSASPISDLAGRYIGRGYEALIDIAAISAITAVLFSMQNANARVWFALSREAIIPRILNRTHPRFKTPTVSIVAFSAVSLVVALGFGAYWGPMVAFGNLGYFAGLGILPIYLLPNIALIRFMWTKHRTEFSWLLHGILPSISSLVIVLALIFTVYPLPASPLNTMPFILLGITVLAIVWVLWLLRNDPERVERVGATVFVTSEELVAGATSTLSHSTVSNDDFAASKEPIR
jgi:amino acid transporter